MKSFQDFTVFNTTNPDTLAPKAKKQMPFPLEDMDAQLAEAYARMNGIMNKLNAALNNPINDTKARKRRIKSLKYKAKTCLSLIRELSAQCQELWF